MARTNLGKGITTLVEKAEEMFHLAREFIGDIRDLKDVVGGRDEGEKEEDNNHRRN